jgi:uncharacterized phage-associated protein
MTSYLTTEAVANWFILKAKENGESITAMKLQKLIYYAHGWCLALYNVALVEDQVQAWIYGPVFPRLYHLAKAYGSEPIDSLLYGYLSAPSIVQDSDPRIPLLEKIWEVFGKYSASQLSRMTHEPDGPWDKISKSYPGRKRTTIPEDLLTDYFAKTGAYATARP